MIKGHWFKTGSAARIDAALHCHSDGHYSLQVLSGDVLSGNMEDIQVSDRLGNVPRKLTFRDGSVFATSENDAIDQYFKPYIKSASFVHVLETKWKYAVIAVVLTVAFTFSFFKWGLPAVSSGVASLLPQKTNELIGQHTLTFLDDYIFEESQLDQATQDEIRAHFFAKIVPLESDNEITFTLHFRDWSDDEKGIPNALALPSGDIILTDAFVRLSESQNEIDSVLLHEMGHVAHRHSLKMLVQSSLLTIGIMMTIGDVSGAADLGVGMGSLLLTSDYSRSFESEADQYAFEHMLIAKIDPIAFSQIMNRLSKYSLSAKKKDDSVDDSIVKEESVNKKSAEDSVLGYFSSHPKTAERVKQAERYSLCFKQGLSSCN